MAEKRVEVMEESGSESDSSDVTVVSNPRKRQQSPKMSKSPEAAASPKPPQQKKAMLDSFVAMAENVIAESEAILKDHPNAYGGIVEVQHSTLKETIYAAERFLYGSPHTEGDAITGVTKKLWHLNSRYSYHARQVEKKNAETTPPQPNPVITQPVPAPRIFTSAIA